MLATATGAKGPEKFGEGLVPPDGLGAPELGDASGVAYPHVNGGC